MGDMRAVLRVMVGAALLCACCSDAQKQEEFRLRAADERTGLELSGGATVVDGAVVLNATAAGEEDAVALYGGTSSRMRTFVTSFAFSSSSPGPAILAFVIVPRALQLASSPDSALLQAEHTFAAESELASSGALQFLLRQLPVPPAHDLPPALACNDDSFVTIEYNASALAVAIHSACYRTLPPLLTFIDLSYTISQDDMDVGFIASNGGVFIVSQWNFTSNPPPTAFPLLNSSRSGSQESNPTMSAESADGGTSGGGDGHSGSAGTRHHGLGKPFVVAFSVLGASILGVILLGVFFLCFRPPMKRPRASHNQLGDRPLRDATALGATASSPPLQAMRDSTPLKPIPSPNSSEFAMSVTGSWLKQPIDAR